MAVSRQRVAIAIVVGLGILAALAATGASLAAHKAPKKIAFKPEKVYPAGYDPISIASGDFDGDGRLDLAAANFASSAPSSPTPISVTVLRGKRKGKFKPVLTFPVPSQPDGIAVGKLAGDGDPDIVIGGFSPSEVTVFKGGPGLSFGPAESYPLDGEPREIEIADFDRDGLADIAVRRQDANDIIVIPGKADGSFAAPTAQLSAGASGQLTELTSGRFNADRIPDLAAAKSNDTVAVFLGRPGGTFAPRKLSAAGPYPTGLAAADFNRDGKTDLVTANQLGDFVRGGAPSKGDFVSILRGRGDGSFKAPRTRAVGKGGGVPRDVVATDFNRDHRMDVAVSMVRFHKIAVLRGRKGGRLTGPKYTKIAGGEAPFALLADRFNKDRRPDLAATQFEFETPDPEPGSVGILLQKHAKKKHKKGKKKG